MTTGDAPLSPADFGWTDQVRLPQLWEPLLEAKARVSLGAVASAHHIASTRTHSSEVREEARLLRRLLRSKFEQRGAIANSYFCRNLPGGIVLIERSDKNPTDLQTVLNSENDRLVALEADCHALVHETRVAFSKPGDQLRPLLDAVYSAMTRVLAAADLAAAPEQDGVRLAAALAAAEREVEHVGTRVRVAIQRQARFVYFQGALFGTVAAVVVCVVLGLVGARVWAEYVGTAALVAATLFGALGAVVSVFQRISTGNLTLDFNASTRQLLLLGSLRPMVGAIFGAVAHFGLGAGLLGATDRPVATVGVFAIVGFTAGFSERFAKDMVERAGQVLADGGSALGRSDDLPR
jgi:hypothetical protein